MANVKYAIVIILLSACLIFILKLCLEPSDLSQSSQSQVAEHNLTLSADNFGVYRRIIFINGITDKYLAEIKGNCTVQDEGNQIEVLCDTSDGVVKHFMGLSDNVTYVVEQIDGKAVSKDRYTINYRPETIIPSIDLEHLNDQDPKHEHEIVVPSE